MIERPRPGVIRLIDEKGEQLGIKEIAEALSIAEERGLDLVDKAKIPRVREFITRRVASLAK